MCQALPAAVTRGHQVKDNMTRGDCQSHIVSYTSATWITQYSVRLITSLSLTSNVQSELPNFRSCYIGIGLQVLLAYPGIPHASTEETTGYYITEEGSLFKIGLKT